MEVEEDIIDKIKKKRLRTAQKTIYGLENCGDESLEREGKE